jgi:hypothetical protein
MRCSRFSVVGVLDGAGGVRKGTVIIERASGIMYVRPYRKRRIYAMPLAMVADMVCRRIIMNELHEKRAAKNKNRRGRR